MASKTAWKRPRRARVIAIRDRLREIYGRPVNHPHGHPIAELVRTILSQNTNDRNRDVAYERLRAALPTWVDVRDADVEEVEEAIRPGGLAPSKAPRIQHVLRELPVREGASTAAQVGYAAHDGEPTLDWLAAADRDEAIDFLVGLDGVGRKTAACVMIFALGRPEIPVDTHVYRVGGRLGLFPPKASFELAHDEMLAITDPEDAYELHVNLITHGRRVCRPKPRCEECGLRRMCPWYRDNISADR
jgi:endonuclease-3